MDHCIAITLFRHGITLANEKKQYLGWSDPRLSELGRKQAYHAKPAVQEVQMEKVFSSDLQRCTETAAILFPNHPIQPVPEMREMNFGDWEMKTYHQLKNNVSYQSWAADPFNSGPPNGEKFTEFEQRVHKGMQLIREQMQATDCRHIAIITHGGVIRTILNHFSPVEKFFFSWKIPYAGGYSLEWETSTEFRRGKMCTSLSEVPITEKHHG